MDNLPDVIIANPKKHKKVSEEDLAIIRNLEINNDLMKRSLIYQNNANKLHTDTEQFILHLDSNYASVYLKDDDGEFVTSGCIFDLSEPIRTKMGDQSGYSRMEISLTHAEIPCTWYNIDDQTNKIRFVDNTVFPGTFYLPKIIEIPKGHYDEASLRSTLEQLLNLNTNIGATYTVEYSAATHKYTFIGSLGVPFIWSMNFNINDSAYQSLGFVNSNYDSITVGTTQVIKSIFSTQLIRAENIYITSSLNTSNVYHPRGNHGNVLAKIPVKVDKKAILYYERSIEQATEITAFSISQLTLRLVDVNGLLFDLNGHHWSCTLHVTVYPAFD